MVLKFLKETVWETVWGMQQVAEVRKRISVCGRVQGVGFRPFIHRLARKYALCGWVKNCASGVEIEVEGLNGAVDDFISVLKTEAPPLSRIASLECRDVKVLEEDSFKILKSCRGAELEAEIPPDTAVCIECLKEISDPGDRRFRYPFTNCVNCGPRLSIITALPYDRGNTTMSGFVMCEKCRGEYHDHASRRFHAQPNACPECGPVVELWSRGGRVLAKGEEALYGVCRLLKEGGIAAVKGLGGFHLLADAISDGAVKKLRERKRRGNKPFAVMYPAKEDLEADHFVTDLERELLLSPQAPIVIVERKPGAGLSFFVSPDNPFSGVFLPYTPLHYLLLKDFGSPVVATSGNLAEEPICTDEKEALKRLSGIADLFLVHNRPIIRSVDDSVARVINGRPVILRCGRGYAPLSFTVSESFPCAAAMGGHLKNTVAFAKGKRVIVSQHIGDLSTREAYLEFKKTISDYARLYRIEPECIVCDLHPDYLSTRHAGSYSDEVEVLPVQHHYAHVLSCMGENGVSEPCLGFSWDGTGYGTDGTVWGGEALLVQDGSFKRFSSFRTFKLPGGEQAVKEPRRSALGVLFELFGEEIFTLGSNSRTLAAFNREELVVLKGMLKKNINAPFCSSVGRLFDGVASLLGVCHRAHFESHAAMRLEHLAYRQNDDGFYRFDFMKDDGKESLIVDWAPVIKEILSELSDGLSAETMAVRFHNTLVEIMVETARRGGMERVLLSGGCFQNRYLVERAIKRLKAEGFMPYTHSVVPPNDGGIAFGQIFKAEGRRREI